MQLDCTFCTVNPLQTLFVSCYVYRNHAKLGIKFEKQCDGRNRAKRDLSKFIVLYKSYMLHESWYFHGAKLNSERMVKSRRISKNCNSTAKVKTVTREK